MYWKSLWYSGWHSVLWYNSAIALTFNWYSWEKVWIPLSLILGYGLNSTTSVLWHNITCKGWYAIKQRTQTKMYQEWSFKLKNLNAQLSKLYDCLICKVVQVSSQANRAAKSTPLEEKEDYLWCTGASHCAHVGKSIAWAVIGCR